MNEEAKVYKSNKNPIKQYFSIKNSDNISVFPLFAQITEEVVLHGGGKFRRWKIEKTHNFHRLKIELQLSINIRDCKDIINAVQKQQY